MKALSPILCLYAYVTAVTFMMIYGYKLSGSPDIKKMLNKFTPEQVKIHEAIKVERRTHYLMGLTLGVVLALAYGMRRKCSMTKGACCFFGLVTFVAANFYLLAPKKYWMVEHLDNQGDVKRWNSVYKRFRFMTSFGELLGAGLFAVSHLN